MKKIYKIWKTEAKTKSRSLEHILKCLITIRLVCRQNLMLQTSYQSNEHIFEALQHPTLTRRVNCLFKARVNIELK